MPITYKLYISQSNNLDTVANAEKNGTLATTGTDVSSLTAQNLTSSNSYFYNVVAQDEVGKVAYTQNSVELVDTNIPPVNAPTIVSVTVDTFSALIQHSILSDATFYEFRINTGTVNDVTSNPFTVNSLNEGTTYTVEVRGGNQYGEGPWSDPTEFTTDAIPVPTEAPEIVSIVPDLETADVTRTSVTNANQYQYRLNGSILLNPSPPLVNPYTIPNLSQGTTYDLEVRAGRDGSFGPWSAITQFQTESVVVDQPTITGFSGNESILGVDATFDGVNFATGYDYRLNGGVAVDANEVATQTQNEFSFEVPDLDQKTDYNLQVRGKNEFGSGPWSDVVVVKRLLLEAPNVTFVSNTPTSFTVNVEAISGATGVTYLLQLDNGNFVDVGTGNYTFNNLDPEQTYTVTSRADNAAGQGTVTSSFNFSTAVIPAPTWDEANFTNGQNSIDGFYIDTPWNAVSEATSYEVTRDGVVVYTGSNLTFRYSNLDPDTQYEVGITSTDGTSTSAVNTITVQTDAIEPDDYQSTIFEYTNA